MTKQEFLDELRQSLSGEVSSEAVMDSYRYYSTYIEDEIRNGKSESQVVAELGRPALIARSIIAAHTGEREADEIYTEDGKTRRVKDNPFAQGNFFGAKSEAEKAEEQARREQKQAEREQKKREKQPFVFDLNSWYAKVIYVLIFILLVLIVFGLLRVGFWVLVHWGIPILLILGVLYLIMYFLR
ncbi:MAG: DUF1700 domain-containing protein [Lachnospiraceae bacterium]|nr:DUF1700 domain-containing protein [Lachnospiraceae bacterium]